MHGQIRPLHGRVARLRSLLACTLPTSSNPSLDKYSSVNLVARKFQVPQIFVWILWLQADLPENKAKTVHPELLKFKLEKQAR
jgi:hypothetical protein